MEILQAPGKVRGPRTRWRAPIQSTTEIPHIKMMIKSWFLEGTSNDEYQASINAKSAIKTFNISHKIWTWKAELEEAQLRNT